MDAFLALDGAARTLLCEEAGARLNITAAAVEKDLWVCFALRELFSLDTLGPGLTFKGGTSLSKGWKLIDRFSEDIDVVAHRELFGGGGALTKKQLKKLRKSCQA